MIKYILIVLSLFLLSGCFFSSPGEDVNQGGDNTLNSTGALGNGLSDT